MIGRRGLVFGAAALSLASAPLARAAAGVRGEVVLIPLGRFATDLVDAIERMLREQLQVAVTREAPVALPRAAYYPPRKRYRADRLLEFLSERVAGAPATTRAIGLTSVDISTTNPPFEDWGVFGLGLMPGPAAVVSSFRLRRGARNREHLRFRVAITALHECGHTFGLDHCTESRCPMRDAEGGISNTDDSAEELGPQCRGELDHAFAVGGG